MDSAQGTVEGVPELPLRERPSRSACFRSRSMRLRRLSLPRAGGETSPSDKSEATGQTFLR